MTSESRIRAAIVGLGQVGSRFDEEPRESIWSHAGAFLALSADYDLVAGADPSSSQRDLFKRRCPTAQVFDDALVMVRETKPAVLSICTPAAGRAELVTRLLEEQHRPRVLLCEKPLELSRTSRQAIVEGCQARGVSLIVNYTRRYEHVYRAARNAVRDGTIGRLVSITVRAPNRLWSIGCHALDAISFFAGANATSVHTVARPTLTESGEPAADALLSFPNDVVAHLITVGMRENLLFEIDLIGTEGRLQIVDNGQTALHASFEASPKFVGYRTLSASNELTKRPNAFSPFVELAREAAEVARLDSATSSNSLVSSPGASAMATESILDSIVADGAKA